MPRILTTLKYNSVVTLSNAASGGNSFKFKLNSLFDPEDPVGGHQPYGFDQMSALYNRYRVLRARWKVVVGTSTGTIHIGVVPVNGTPTTVASQITYETAIEMPRSKAYIVGGGGAPTVTSTGSVKLNDLNGVTPTEYLADDRFEAQVTTSPAEVMTLLVCMYNPTASTVVAPVTIDIEYFTDLHDPLVLSGSSSQRRIESTLVSMPARLEPAMRVFMTNNEIIVPQSRVKEIPSEKN
jgi:hypothetical protein